MSKETKTQEVKKTRKQTTISQNPNTKGGYVFHAFEKGWSEKKIKASYKKKFKKELTHKCFVWYKSKHKKITTKK